MRKPKPAAARLKPTRRKPPPIGVCKSHPRRNRSIRTPRRRAQHRIPKAPAALALSRIPAPRGPGPPHTPPHQNLENGAVQHTSP